MKGRKLMGWGVCVAILFNCSFAFAIQYIEPYLQAPKQDGMTILWWTNSSQPNSSVEYGLGNYNNTVAASNDYVSSMNLYKHEVKLNGLSTETTYNYRVQSGSTLSNSYTFKTAINRSSNFRFALLGDGRTDNSTVISRHKHMVDMAGDRGADFIIEAGDQVKAGTASHWNTLYRNIVTNSAGGSSYGSKIPYMTAVGNHEIWDGSSYDSGNLTTSMARYKAFMANPSNGSSNPNWNERYYSFKYGAATFIVLDLNNTSSNSYDNHDYLPDGSTPDWEPGSEQYNWMVNQLQQAQQDSAFTFVIAHPSPYSRGVHGSPSDTQRGYQLRALDPVWRQYGVDAVLTSHDHTVEHCLTGPAGFENDMDVNDPNNLNYLVMGNSGYSSRYAEDGWNTWMDIEGNDGPPYYTKYFYSWAGNDSLSSFWDVNIVNEGNNLWRADFQVVRSDGQIFDPFSIERTDPVPGPATVSLMVIALAGMLRRKN